MSTFRVWAIDCDGPGDIRYAPTFDTEAEAQAWIDEFMKDDQGDITRIWIEEEDDADYVHDIGTSDEEDDPTPYYGFEDREYTMGMDEHDERL